MMSLCMPRYRWPQGPCYCFPVTSLKLRSGHLGDLMVMQRCLPRPLPLCRPGMWLGSLSIPALCLVASFHVPRAAPDQPRVKAPVPPRPPGCPGQAISTHLRGGGWDSRAELRCLGPLAQQVLCVAWWQRAASLGSGSFPGAHVEGSLPCLCPHSCHLTPAPQGHPVSK